MLFTLVTPAFADEEPLPDGAAVEEIAGGEAGEENATKDEEVTLFDGGQMVPVTPPSGGSGGGGVAYPVEDGVAAVNNCDQFFAAMNDERVTGIVVEGEVWLYPGEQMVFMTDKDITVKGRLDIGVQLGVCGNFTVEDGARVNIKLDDSGFGKLEVQPRGGEPTTLTVNGKVEVQGGLWLYYPCGFSMGERGQFVETNGAQEFARAEYVGYQFSEGVSDGAYTDTTICSKFPKRALLTNTAAGFAAACADTNNVVAVVVENRRNEDVTELTLAPDTATTYGLPATLLAQIPMTIGANATVNLKGEPDGMGIFNSFAFGLTVAAGGTLNNAPGSNLNFDGGYTNIAGTFVNNGNLGFYANGKEDCVEINGELINNGRMENCNALIIKQDGKLTVNDSDKKITYKENREEASDHALFNRNFIKVEQGGMLTVGGYLQNNGRVEVCGEMWVKNTAQDNNKAPDTDGYGVLNGAVQSFGDLDVNGGTLHIMGASESEGASTLTAKPYAGALVSHGKLSIHENGRVIADGQLWTVGEVVMENNGINKEHSNLEVNGEYHNFAMFRLENGLVTLNGRMQLEDGELCIKYGKMRTEGDSELYIRNSARVIVSEGGTLAQNGYIQNDNEIRIDGGVYTIKTVSTDNTSDNCVGQNSVLCNNSYLGVHNRGLVDVKAEEGSFSGIIHNNGHIGIDGGENGGTLTLCGMLRNFNTVENRGSFTVSDAAARIENHGRLQVGDSATFGGDEFGRINWQDGASAELNLEDELVYRIWMVMGPEYRRPDENFNSIKDSEMYGNIVMRGQDYFGGWVDAKQLQRDDKIESFGVVSADDGVVSVGADDGRYDTFSLFFHEWGDTELSVLVNGEVVRTYDAHTCLNHIGFYFDRAVTRDGYIDEQEAQNRCAVLGNCCSYDIGEQLWLMRCGEAFFEHELDPNGFCLNIWRQDSNGGEADVSGPDDYGWYHASMDGEEYFKFRPERRPHSEGYDILFEFTGGECNYEIDGDFCGNHFYLRCFKPAVYIENVAGVKGGDVTVAVKAENFPGLLGYQLQLKFDASKLTAKSVEAVGEYEADPMVSIDETNGTVRVIAASTENNRIENGELLRVTFTVADTDAVGGCEDIGVAFDDGYQQNMAVGMGDSEKNITAGFHGGFVQTFIPGDVHRDAKVDILDAVRLLRAVVGLVELSPAEYEAGRLLENVGSPDVSCVLEIMRNLAYDTPLEYLKPAQV